jgi:hypothetical protein
MTAFPGRRHRNLAILLCCLAAAGRSAAADGIVFEWIQRGDVVQDGGVSAGLAWGDYDGDGDPDLFIANWRGQPNLLYRNQEGELVRVTDGPVAAATSWSSDGAWGDYDGDGDLDLFVANQNNQHNELYRNDGEAGFVRVEEGDIVSDFGDSYSAAWGDYDGDGHLDLVVANSGTQPNFLYRNRGDSTFERLDDPSWTGDREPSHGVSWADYDDDGDLDLFVANYSPAPNALYRNEGDKRLARVAEGPIAEDAVSSLGGAWADYDNDGDLDLFVANSVGFFGPAKDVLYRNDGEGGFTPVDSAATRDPGASGGASWADVDLDGDLDLFVVGYASPNHLYLNDGQGDLQPMAQTFPLDLAHFATGHGWADYDADGDPDLAVANWQGQDNNLFGNPGSGARWLRVQLRSDGPNRRAIGAKIRLATGTGDERVWQRRDVAAGGSFRSQEPADQLFGLGTAERVAELVVEWPSGAVETVTDLAADATVTLVEGRGVVSAHPVPAAAPSVAAALTPTVEAEGIEAAIARYHQLRRAQPSAWDYGPDALSALTISLLRQGQPDASVRIQQLAVEEFPRSGAAGQLLVRLYEYLGRAEEAHSALNALVARVDELEGLHEDEREALRNQVGFLEKHAL